MTLIAQVAMSIRDAERHAGLRAHVHADDAHGVIDVEADGTQAEVMAAFALAAAKRDRFALHFEARS